MKTTRARAAWGTVLVLATAAPSVSFLAGPAAAGQRDPYGVVRNVLPPGSSGNVDAATLFTLGPGKASSPGALFDGLRDPHKFFTMATPTSPTNFADQLEIYDALNTVDPASLTDSQLGRYFKDASLGVDPADVVRTERPRPGVTIEWDKDGVPHITGVTDEDVGYGAGVALMQTRMFLADVLRHTGAATMSSFLGPTDDNIAQDSFMLTVAPYTQEQIAAQTRPRPDAAPEADRLSRTADAFIDGINATQKALCPATTASVPLPGNLGLGFGEHCPVEYAVLQRPPAPWTRGDLIAIAALTGGVFGTGGGGQYTNAIWLQQLQEKFGVQQGRKIYDDLRGKNDPESPVTSPVSAPYGGPSGIRPDLPGVALPDLHPTATQLGTGAIVNPDGSLSRPRGDAPGSHGSAGTTDPKPTPSEPPPVPSAGQPTVPASVDPWLKARQIKGALQRAMEGGMVGMSNAILVDAKHSATGHPVAVFGPQTGYYAPQLLMEQELRGPHYAVRGVSFAGSNFLVAMGRGIDYAWSATSPFTDVTDTVIQHLCNPDGSPATVDSTAYVDGSGRCTPMVNYQHTQIGVPNVAAQGSPTRVSLLVLRTDQGIVRLRTTVKGKPVAVVIQRSTYMHEADSALGIARFNDPGYVRDAASFMKAASAVQYTFNWYYLDDKDIAYYSAGKLPIRAPGTDMDLPRWGLPAYDWKGFVPFEGHPHVVNPPTGYLANWNNKLAPNFSSASRKWGDGPVYRSLPLSDRLDALFARGKAVTRADAVGVMIDAGTVDVRGAYVLPHVLDVIGTPSDPQDAAAVALLRRWIANGAHRVDRARTGSYADQAAIALFDTWWDPADAGADCAPDCDFLLAKDAMRAGLGSYVDVLPQPIDDSPRANIGSAFNGVSWYGYLNKDLRSVLGKPVQGAYSRRYCGSLATCRAALTASLHAATAAALATQEVSSVSELTYDKSRDSIISVSGGVVGARPIDWQNRPTFQQVAQFTGSRAARPAAQPVQAAPGRLPATGADAVLPLVALALIGLGLVARARRTSTSGGGTPD